MRLHILGLAQLLDRHLKLANFQQPWADLENVRGSKLNVVGIKVTFTEITVKNLLMISQIPVLIVS